MTNAAAKTEEPADGRNNVFMPIIKALFGDGKKKTPLTFEEYVREQKIKVPDLQVSIARETEATEALNSQLLKQGRIGPRGAANQLVAAQGRARTAYEAELRTYEARRAGLPTEYQAYVEQFNQQRETELKAEGEKPFAERNPGATELIMVGVGGVILVASRGIARNQVGNYNTQLADLSTRTHAAVTGFHKEMGIAQTAATDAAREVALRNAARHGNDAVLLAPQQAALVSQGISSGALTVASCVAGDFGMAVPVVADYARSTPGSPLREKVSGMMDPTKPELYGRVATGCLVGMAAGHGMQQYTVGRRIAVQSDYSAEAKAIGNIMSNQALGGRNVLDNLRAYSGHAAPAAAAAVAPAAPTAVGPAASVPAAASGQLAPNRTVDYLGSRGQAATGGHGIGLGTSVREALPPR